MIDIDVDSQWKIFLSSYPQKPIAENTTQFIDQSTTIVDACKNMIDYYNTFKNQDLHTIIELGPFFREKN